MGNLTIDFLFSYLMTEQVQFPKTILAGVSEFGGILAVIKVVTMLMHWINRRQFEKKVTKFMKKE